MKVHLTKIHLGLVALATLAALGGCRTVDPNSSTVLTNGSGIGEFKGFDAVNQYVIDRLIDPSAPAPGPVTASPFPGGLGSQGFSLAQYLNNDNGLEALLGTFVQANGQTIFENKTPNALNLALWQAVFTRFTNDVSKACGATPPSFTLQASFLATLKTECQWPAAPAKDPAALKAFWVAVMGYQAPEDEFTAWSTWFTGQAAYAQMTGPQAVQAMMLAIMMNPYYLLSD